MSMDLIISDTGKILIASSAPFPAEVTRVDFDAASRSVTLNYAGDSQPAATLPLAVSETMAPALMQAARVMLVTVDNRRIVQGFDVPLTCIDL
jgi:hypothetical protein